MLPGDESFVSGRWCLIDGLVQPVHVVAVDQRLIGAIMLCHLLSQRPL